MAKQDARDDARGGISKTRTQQASKNIKKSSGAPKTGPHQDAPGQPSDYSGVVSIPSVQQSTGFHPSGSGVIQDTGGIFAPGQGSGAAAWNPPGGGGPAVVDGQIVNIPPDDEETIIDKTIDKVKKTPNIIQNLVSQWGGGIPVLLIKALFGKGPTKEQLSDPNFLAMMFDRMSKDEGRVDQFVEDYKGTMAEAIGMQPTMSTDTVKAAFKSSLENAKQEAIDSGIFQGSEAQRRIAPWDYYNPDLYEGSQEQAEALEGYPEFLTKMGLEPTSSRFALTSGNLEKIAKIPLDSIPYDEQGRKFRRQVLAAREQVGRDRDRRERQSGGGGGGIFPPDPIYPIDPIDPVPTLPDPPPGTTPILPPGTTLTPGPFDYLQWPQFTSAYPGHYANQGIPGQAWPQYDYWNQIAKTFPGMR